MKKLTGVMGGLLLLGGSLVAAPKTAMVEGVLAPGSYTATVKAFACGGCAEWIQSKLSAVKSLEKVSADQKTRVVRFTVKKDAQVKRSDIQKTLDAAAKDMGMGADYTMTDFQRAKISNYSPPSSGPSGHLPPRGEGN